MGRCVWRVEYVKATKTSKSTGEDGLEGRKRMYTGAAEKYTGAAQIYTYDISEGAAVSTLAISPSVVAFATQRGGCKVWDFCSPPEVTGEARLSPYLGIRKGRITSLANANGEVLTSDFSSVPFVNSGNVVKGPQPRHGRFYRRRRVKSSSSTRDYDICCPMESSDSNKREKCIIRSNAAT